MDYEANDMYHTWKEQNKTCEVDHKMQQKELDARTIYHTNNEPQMNVNNNLLFEDIVQ